MSTRKKRSKRGKNLIQPGADDDSIIVLETGWNKINSNGIQPFLRRIENIDEEEKFEKRNLPKDQYCLTYDCVFQMCIQIHPHNYAAALYSNHGKTLIQYFKAKFVPALKKTKEKHVVVFLKEWIKRWRCNKWAVDGLTRMFLYLDRVYVLDNEKLLTTSKQGYDLFRKHVFERFKNIAKDGILSCVSRERNGEEQDRDLLRDAILVYVELGEKTKIKPKDDVLAVYKIDFHEQLVRETRQYYKQKSRFWLDQLSCPEYLIQAEKCVDEENARLQSYFNKCSIEDLMLASREELLKFHQKELLKKDTGIDSILNRTVGIDGDVAKEDLSRLFRLYEPVVNGLPDISEAMRKHICVLGNRFIQKSKDETKNNTEKADHALIRSLIDLHDRFLSLVKIEFQQNPLFQDALKDAFQEFINKEYYTSALLARFANDILKKGTKIAIADLENTMDHVVMLYSYIRDKDIFERDYQQYLGSRLLQDLSESEQSERSMIGKLKTASGYHWTAKLENMFKDIQLSKELMQEFKKSIGKRFVTELNVSVCTTGSWPTSSILPVKCSQSLVKICDMFTQFYVHKHSGKRLTFQMNKGKANISVQFSAKIKKILVVSTYQMIILLLFNNKITYTFKQMLDDTGIPREELIVSLLSMVHPKVKIMRKAPGGKDVHDDHKFQINPKYTNPRAKINIPTLRNIGPQKPVTDQDGMKGILTSRRLQMNAAIVRIMKARKILEHNLLLTEVVKQLQRRFQPKPVDIKKRIANLIELEYLERDPKNRKIYHYIPA